MLLMEKYAIFLLKNALISGRSRLYFLSQTWEIRSKRAHYFWNCRDLMGIRVNLKSRISLNKIRSYTCASLGNSKSSCRRDKYSYFTCSEGTTSFISCLVKLSPLSLTRTFSSITMTRF